MRYRLRSLAFCSLIIGLSGGLPAGAAQKTRKVTVEALIYDLEHPDPERRREAAVALGQNKVRQAVPDLVKLTRDPSHEIRLEAVRALVNINDRRALDALLDLTQDPYKDIQEKSIEGLIRLYVVEEGGFVEGVKKVVTYVNPFSDDYNPLVVEPYVLVDSRVIDALVRLLDVSDSSLRREAAAALGILRAAAALPSIEARLKIEKSDGVKVALIRAIYKISDPAAGSTLIPFTRDGDKKVHDEAVFALGRLRVREAVPYLTDLYEAGIEERKKFLKIVPVSGTDDFQKKLMEALAYIGDPRSRDLFINALQDESSFYRRYGAEGLARLADPSLVTRLGRSYVSEKDDDAKLAMSFALYRMGREEHLDELVAGLKSGDQGYYYLLEMEPSEVRKLYDYLYRTKNPVKVRLLDIMGLRGDQSALPVAEDMMSSRDSDVASAANLAVRRLRGRHSTGAAISN